jgi:hypothetical protein
MRLAQRTSTPNRARPARPATARATPALLTAAVLLAGCGGSSGSPALNAAAAREQAQEQEAETEFEHYAKCLREHGVNAEVLSRPGGAHGLKISPGSGGPAALERAERACARYRPTEPSKGTEPPQVKVEHEEQIQRFARCMREHGIPVQADTSGGLTIQIKRGSGAPTPESPAFQAAQSTCHKRVPQLGLPSGP